jgi:hypothetical protein
MDNTSFQGIDDTSFLVSILPEKCYPCLPPDLSPMSPDRTNSAPNARHHPPRAQLRYVQVPDEGNADSRSAAWRCFAASLVFD